MFGDDSGKTVKYIAMYWTITLFASLMEVHQNVIHVYKCNTDTRLQMQQRYTSTGATKIHVYKDNKDTCLQGQQSNKSTSGTKIHVYKHNYGTSLPV